MGINLEDRDKESQKIYPAEVAAERIRRALATAKAIGVPDFMINAHTDILVHGGELSEAIERGKAYLAAGTNTVFVWVALHMVESRKVKLSNSLELSVKAECDHEVGRGQSNLEGPSEDWSSRDQSRTGFPFPF